MLVFKISFFTVLLALCAGQGPIRPSQGKVIEFLKNQNRIDSETTLQSIEYDTGQKLVTVTSREGEKNCKYVVKDDNGYLKLIEIEEVSTFGTANNFLKIKSKKTSTNSFKGFEFVYPNQELKSQTAQIKISFQEEIMSFGTKIGNKEIQQNKRIGQTKVKNPIQEKIISFPRQEFDENPLNAIKMQSMQFVQDLISLEKSKRQNQKGQAQIQSAYAYSEQ